MTPMHIVIDMQRLVAEQTAWHSPAVAGILPNVLKLSSAFRDETLYARFVTPPNIDAAHGCWKPFYRRWPMVTGEQLDPRLLDLMEPLAKLARPHQLFDKSGFSIFSSQGLDACLKSAGVDTVILSGTETDVCVYSSALAAIDLGYVVIIASDAVSSPDSEAHRLVLATLAPRLPEQIRVLDTDAILRTFSRNTDA